MGIGSILGGLAGLLIPGGGAIASAIGSGLGSLVIDKEDPKDAIKNALLAGVGAKVLGPALQGSSVGKAITGGLGSLGLGTSAGLAALQAGAPAAAGVTNAVAQGLGANATGGIFGGAAQAAGAAGATGGVFGNLLQNPNMLYAGMSALGALEGRDGGDMKQLYTSRYTGLRYETPEERDAEERQYAMKNFDLSGPELDAELGRPRASGYARGGYIQGPGTGRSDSIPATIYQDGRPVQDAALSDGEFVMTEQAVRGAGNGDRNKGAAKMYAMMRQFERGAA